MVPLGSTPVQVVCVYCGSSPGHDAAYVATARELGTHLARSSIRIVYGGGAVGLMGQVADAALAAGGEVVGVIPRGLFRREVGHTGLTELYEVASMHERKQLMFELADAFVALPGGLGTLEELLEITTWAQLGLHSKPIVTLDVDGFWQPFHRFLAGAVRRGFVKRQNLELIVNVGTVDDVLPALARYSAPPVTKWLELPEV